MMKLLKLCKNIEQQIRSIILENIIDISIIRDNVQHYFLIPPLLTETYFDPYHFSDKILMSSVFIGIAF